MPPLPTNTSVNAPQSLEAFWGFGNPCPFDEVLDVRTPAEFAGDHLPDAVNVPVLSDAERIEVGTLYRRTSAFQAARVGAAYMSANIAMHLRAHFSDKGKEYKPLLYCWRGGQRSSGLAHVLARVGWRVSVLNGGYKAYRGQVLKGLASVPPTLEVRIVSGATGSGKTRLLHALAARGAQVLDLEALAGHRGSVLGRAGPQPSQPRFDSLLLAAVSRFDPARPVWIEAESNRIGDVYLPAALWATMRAAPGIELQMPAAARVRHLVEDYSNLFGDPDALKGLLQRLAPKHDTRQLEAWCRQVDAREWNELAASLLAIHYDPAYAASNERYYPRANDPVTIGDAEAAEIDDLAASLHTDRD